MTSGQDVAMKEQDEFLAVHGWADADKTPLAPDASFRYYTRLNRNGESRMLMTAPPAHENLPAYLTITAHLHRLGLRAPTVYGADTKTGFALIEDFGDATFTRLLAAGEDELSLYLLAVDVLKALHAHPARCDVAVPPYDMAALMREVKLFTEWFVPAFRGREVSAAEQSVYDAAWQDVLADMADRRETLVLRDYHVDNLMVVKGEGIGRCGLLDYQDALIGARAYDLVSLLEDARRDVSPNVRAAALDRYLEGREPERAGLVADMAILGAQRHAKVAGIFVRLSRRDGKNIYLKHIPRVLGLLENCLRAPGLAPLRAVIDDMVPGYRGADIGAL